MIKLSKRKHNFHQLEMKFSCHVMIKLSKRKHNFHQLEMKFSCHVMIKLSKRKHNFHQLEVKSSCHVMIKFSKRKQNSHAKIKGNVDWCIYLQDVSKLIKLLLQDLLLFQILKYLILKHFLWILVHNSVSSFFLPYLVQNPVFEKKKNRKNYPGSDIIHCHNFQVHQGIFQIRIKPVQTVTL